VCRATSRYAKRTAKRKPSSKKPKSKKPKSKKPKSKKPKSKKPKSKKKTALSKRAKKAGKAVAGLIDRVEDNIVPVADRISDSVLHQLTSRPATSQFPSADLYRSRYNTRSTAAAAAPSYKFPSASLYNTRYGTQRAAAEQPAGTGYAVTNLAANALNGVKNLLGLGQARPVVLSSR
jgi:hypothetical protein